MVRLAYGVVAGRDLGVWAPGPDGVPVDAARSGLDPGTAIVVGPRDSSDRTVAAALSDLGDLVAAGGVLAAGAGVDLGSGVRTARLAGAEGDRRDALLAALRVLGADGATRLGDRGAVLVALFGPSVTKPVGTAAATALDDGRWSVVHLASAASDILGPEQLERVLRLPVPEGHDRGDEMLASALAANLVRVLGPLAKPRRLALLLDLWELVGTRTAESARRRRLLDVQGIEDRLADVRERYRRSADDQALAQARYAVGDTRPVNLVQWTPGVWHWQFWMRRAMHDALAATVLLRAAIAVAEHGLADGLARVRSQLATAEILISETDAAQASDAVPELIRVPARPGAYVRDLDDRLRPGQQIGRGTESFVRERLARARDYGVVVLEAVRDLLYAFGEADVYGLGDVCTCEHLRQWREVAGFTELRSPAAWQQPMVCHESEPLAQRLMEEPGAAPADLEHIGDLLWFAELGDAVAQLDGHPAAAVEYGQHAPTVDADPPAAEAAPMRPLEDSLPLAIAGAAELIDLGAEVPARPRAWRDLVDGLMASTVVAEALTGSFPVPKPLLDRDGVTVPGTEARLEIARDPRQLLDWSTYMSNCIAGPYYLGVAMRGRSVLAGLRGGNGRLLANLELIPERTGWRVSELWGRFNADPPAELSERVHAWAQTLPAYVPPARMATPQPRRGHGTVHRPYRRAQALVDLREALSSLATQAVETSEVRAAVPVLSQAGTGAAGGIASIIALRHARQPDIDNALRHGLGEGAPTLRVLWRATAVRPLAAAMAGLDSSMRERNPRIEQLLGDGPLLALPRRLDRIASIGEARSVELVARRLRRALGRLARAADPVLAPLVPRHAGTELLCALVLAVSTGSTAPPSALTRVTEAGQARVPGFPASTLDDDDGPWRVAADNARELGARLDWSESHPALAVPTDWLGRGGWPALWARANRASNRSTRR
jgi:hypothetical protein